MEVVFNTNNLDVRGRVSAFLSSCAHMPVLSRWGSAAFKYLTRLARLTLAAWPNQCALTFEDMTGRAQLPPGYAAFDWAWLLPGIDFKEAPVPVAKTASGKPGVSPSASGDLDVRRGSPFQLLSITVVSTVETWFQLFGRTPNGQEGASEVVGVVVGEVCVHKISRAMQPSQQARRQLVLSKSIEFSLHFTCLVKRLLPMACILFSLIYLPLYMTIVSMIGTWFLLFGRTPNAGGVSEITVYNVEGACCT